MNYNKLANSVGSLAREVGLFIKSEQEKLSSIKIETKSLNSLVSYVDKEAEKKLISSLSALLPEAGFIAEERTVDPKKADFQWIVDPLDGTTNFLHGLPIFSVSIALTHLDDLVVGVVYEVGQDELFVASKNNGTTLNGKAIEVTETENLSDTLLATGFPYYDFKRLPVYLELLSDFFKTTRGVRRMGSAAVDLAYVAAGRFDGFFEYGLSPWDVAAGTLLVEEAGGMVNDFSNGKNILFGKEIWASNGKIHEEISKKLSQLAEIK